MNRVHSLVIALTIVCLSGTELAAEEHVSNRRVSNRPVANPRVSDQRVSGRRVSDQSSAARPNVILCMADDQGWGDVGFRGHPVLQTPVMDELAATGLCFDRFYAAAPVCSPTRGSVMTGRHPNRFGCFSWGYTLRPQERTLAEIMRDNGYATGHFGKWHLGSVREDNPANPGESGFDEWFSAPNFFENSPILSREGTAVATSGEGSMVTVEAALEFIEAAQSRSQPFFAVVWFGSPHLPHEALDDDLELYSDEPERRQHFFGEITAMDRAVGQLRSRLKELELRENTILWYTSDNGALPNVGSTGGLKGRKGQLGDGGLRVPSMVEWPAVITEPRQTSFPACSTDILPTILAWCEIEDQQLPILDGISLANLHRQDPERREKPLGFWVYPKRGISTPSASLMAAMLAEQQDGAPQRLAGNEDAWKMPEERYPDDQFPGNAAWIDGDMKLRRTQRGEQGPRLQLYDLGADPNETTDIASQHPQLAEKLNQALTEWQSSVVKSLNGDDYPSVEDEPGNN